MTSAISPEAAKAIQSPRAPDAPRRCFICLTDQDPSDPPNSWVDPCPCTLEAHQDCMLSWVTDCERSGKPLSCPICKSQISLEGPWDPIVALTEAIQSRFTYVSPMILFSGMSLGVHVSSQMYGMVAMWMFAGHDAVMDYMTRGSWDFDGGSPLGVKAARVSSVVALGQVAPVLLIGQLLPGLGNRIFVPTASLYGIYHVMRDEHFVSWPPSPRLALAVFPYIRSIYYNLWREFVQPYEVSLNRQIMGLPPVDNQDDRNRRNGPADRNAEGGIVGFLQTLIDALDNDEEDAAAQGGANLHVVGQGGNADDGDVVLDVEFLIEEERARNAAEGGDGAQRDDDFDGAHAAGNRPGEEHQPGGEQPPARPAAHQEAQAAQPDDHGHEAPQPPPNRVGLGNILSSISNSLTSALLLPGISFVMGEALRLMLPSSWVTSPRFPARLRLGLLQQQWGRSLVGGCLYVVIKDVMRLYAKHRKVATMGNRMVKNVDRPRRHGGSGRRN